jgi:DNA-binding response OmpR family regulator
MARILIVDDDADILKLAKAVLTHEKHFVFTAEDAIKAMDILHSHPVDLLISDANMPHYSGFDLVQTLRHDPKFSDLPVAMLTGLRERKDIEKAIKAGVDDYIVKPLDPLILIQKIASILEKRPPQEIPKILFSPENQISQGTLKTKMTLISVSEAMIEISFCGPLEIGEFIELHCPEFEAQLGESFPACKVLEKEKDGEMWRYTLTYLGARESYLQKVRKWIFTNGSRKAAS